MYEHYSLVFGLSVAAQLCFDLRIIAEMVVTTLGDENLWQRSLDMVKGVCMLVPGKGESALEESKPQPLEHPQHI